MDEIKPQDPATDMPATDVTDAPVEETAAPEAAPEMPAGDEAAA